jgi:hypothetical protein
MATEAWRSLVPADIAAFESALLEFFKSFPVAGTPNESQTEQDLIHPILKLLGWEHTLPQVRASIKGRSDVPDVLLFENAEAKAKANAESEPAKRFRHGLAVCEDKAWQIPLDRSLRSKALQEVPSTQILRYLTVSEIQSERKIQWGILTNGRHWRLYWQQARSRSEEFLELDLPAILGLPGFEDLFLPTEEKRQHWLKVFLLLFRRQAFLPGADGRDFHALALDEGRHWEERVARDLSTLVFDQVFPSLISSIVANDPHAANPPSADYLASVKEGALILLYRLLFILYAEDRNLLPVRDKRYDDYGMRKKVREDIASRIDEKNVFAETLGDYHSRVKRLFKAISKGERSLGLPPYNGGLFDDTKTPILERIELPDAVFAPMVDALSRHDDGGRKRWINYRDLSVQQLGSIYERLLEYEPAFEKESIVIRPNIFARKGSGSYYTSEELVALIIERTVGPLIDEKRDIFKENSLSLASDKRPNAERLRDLAALDPASAILTLRICDPAMGSGHFLVSLVDYLADRVLEAIAEAATIVSWGDYVSPLVERIAALRGHIESQAKSNNWAVENDQLDDRLIVRRIILKRVVHGVDMNPMAVELAKVALWLHTFTVGAPLSFLDHHLRCGNSLFGELVRPVMNELSTRFSLTINPHVQAARRAAKGMQQIEDLSDIDIGEVKTSAETFVSVCTDTQPLEKLLNLRQGLRWLGVDDLGKANLHPALVSLFDGSLGDLLKLATGRLNMSDDGQEPDLVPSKKKSTEFSKSEIMATAARILGRVRDISRDQHFMHWQVAFPDVWDQWESGTPSGGFDAIIGNPPWDRMKLQEVEWFAARKPEVALAQTAALRKRLIDRLIKDNDHLVGDYHRAQRMAEAATRVARNQGHFPLLSGGDLNIYSLFVEQALSLIKPDGMVGLVTPSGIASDLGASKFFSSIATTGRLACLFDFENKGKFFPDVHNSFKFCVVVMGGKTRSFPAADCAFFLHGSEEIGQPERSFSLKAEDFRRINPNTGTAPVFRTTRDAELTRSIYARLPVLVEKDKPPVWPVRYLRMFDMTNDSGLFRTSETLKADGFYQPARNRWKKGPVEYVPLYEGKMVQAFDHRAASVIVNPANIHRPAQPEAATATQHADPKWLPNPQFWVPTSDIAWPEAKHHSGIERVDWAIGFKDVTAPTNARTMIAAIVPCAGHGNTLPLLVPDYPAPLTPDEHYAMIEEYACLCASMAGRYKEDAPLWLANLNSVALDFTARQKVQGQHLNWYILEQLPVVPPSAYEGKVGERVIADLIREEVLRLTFTADDMPPFARDQGYEGQPFAWDEDERRHSRARLDAIYFMLYGLDRNAAAYVLDTFPIVREQDLAAHKRYLTKDLILGYMAAFAANDPETRIHV